MSNNPKRDELHPITVDDLLASGAFGRVCRVRRKTDGQLLLLLLLHNWRGRGGGGLVVHTRQPALAHHVADAAAASAAAATREILFWIVLERVEPTNIITTTITTQLAEVWDI